MIGVRGFFVKTEQGKTKGLDTSGPSGEKIDRRTLFPPVYRSTTRAGLLLFCCCVPAHDYRKQTDDRVAGEPTSGAEFPGKVVVQAHYQPENIANQRRQRPQSTQLDSPMIHHRHPLPLLECALLEAAMDHLKIPFELIEELNDLSINLGDELRQYEGEIFRFAT
ncbi:MAG: hypothetical protein FI733_08735 [SAR202 cluster bacterium]|nr:hypothetical protein [SAR202 cluster bacterium]